MNVLILGFNVEIVGFDEMIFFLCIDWVGIFGSNVIFVVEFVLFIDCLINDLEFICDFICVVLILV